MPPRASIYARVEPAIASSDHAAAVARASSLRAANQAQASSAHAAADAKASSLEAANQIQASSVHSAADAEASSLESANQVEASSIEAAAAQSLPSTTAFVVITTDVSILPSAEPTSGASVIPSITTTLPSQTSVSLTGAPLPTASSSLSSADVLSTDLSSTTDSSLVPHSTISPSSPATTNPTTTTAPATVTITSIFSPSTPPPAAQNSSQTPAILGLEISLPLISFFIISLLAFLVLRRRRQRKPTIEPLKSDSWHTASASVSIKELESTTHWDGKSEALNPNRELNRACPKAELEGVAWMAELDAGWKPPELTTRRSESSGGLG